jgi:HEAT repeat protein
MSSDNQPISAELSEFIQSLRQAAEEPNPPPWLDVTRFGPEAVSPLAAMLAEPEIETGRNAKRALYHLVRHNSGPSVEPQRKAIQEQLVTLLEQPHACRDALWLLSEIGDDQAVDAIAKCLRKEKYREDARCALARIPGKKSIEALRAAMSNSPEDFRFALADVLRQLGEKISEYPTRKLVPTAQTTVEPIKS